MQPHRVCVKHTKCQPPSYVFHHLIRGSVQSIPLTSNLIKNNWSNTTILQSATMTPPCLRFLCWKLTVATTCFANLRHSCRSSAQALHAFRDKRIDLINMTERRPPQSEQKGIHELLYVIINGGLDRCSWHRDAVHFDRAAKKSNKKWWEHDWKSKKNTLQAKTCRPQQHLQRNSLGT